ncbi:MAG: type 4a pilus biogenesis protein PilO [Planctomycetota bacterium]
MRIEKSQWVVAGTIAGLLLVFGLGVWLPESRKLSVYQERIEAAELALGPNFNQPAALAARMEEVSELKDKVDSSDRYVAAAPELASLLRSLTKVARANEIDDQEFSTRATRHHRHYSEIPIELNMRSSFAAAYDLLEAVETMPRVVRVDGMSLRLVEEDSAQTKPQMRATYRINGFFTERQEEGS